MITATFFTASDLPVGLRVCGHSGLADPGFDIVCAAVSSAVMLAVNTITDTFGIAAEVEVKENEVRLTDCRDQTAARILEALRNHLCVLESDYPTAVNVITKQVEE